MRQRVLVLGGTGFVGSRVAHALAASPLYEPVVASRSGTVRLDATDLRQVRDVLPTVDCVVNCIAGSEQAMIRSTAALCAAARKCPPRQIVHISSMAVYGAATGFVQERTAPVSPVSGYGLAKMACEEAMVRFVEDGGHGVILRPGCVFGPGGPQWTVRIARLLRSGRLGDLGAAGDGFCNLTDVDDLADAVLRCLALESSAGSIFNVASVISATWNDFLIKYAMALGATPVRRIGGRRLRVETKIVAPALLLASFVTKSAKESMITPSFAGLMRQRIQLDCSSAEEALGLRWTPLDRMILAVTGGETAGAYAVA